MPTFVTTSFDDYDWLSETDGSNPVMLRWNPDQSRTITPQTTTLDMDGRRFPLAYFGRRATETWSLAYDLIPAADGADQWPLLRYLVETRRKQNLVAGRYAPLLWRSKLAGTVMVHVTKFEQDPHRPGPRRRVMLTLERLVL